MRMIHPFCKILDNSGLENLQRMNVISIPKKVQWQSVFQILVFIFVSSIDKPVLFVCVCVYERERERNIYREIDRW